MNLWSPPAGTSPNKVTWGDDFVFPVVFGGHAMSADTSMEVTHFGIWRVSVVTGEATYTEAPFYFPVRYRGVSEWHRHGCRLRSGYDGGLMLVVRRKFSYDFGYTIFIFDGDRWMQTTRSEPSRLLTPGVDHDVYVWKEAGPVVLPPILQGGGLMHGTDPFRLAVDYTHAFAYDSGPDTPNSPEYIALSKENEARPPKQSLYRRCTTEDARAVFEQIPLELRDRFDEAYWGRQMMRYGDRIWVTAYDHSDGNFIGFMEFADNL